MPSLSLVECLRRLCRITTTRPSEFVEPGMLPRELMVKVCGACRRSKAKVRIHTASECHTPSDVHFQCSGERPSCKRCCYYGIHCTYYAPAKRQRGRARPIPTALQSDVINAAASTDTTQSQSAAVPLLSSPPLYLLDGAPLAFNGSPFDAHDDTTRTIVRSIAHSSHEHTARPPVEYQYSPHEFNGGPPRSVAISTATLSRTFAPSPRPVFVSIPVSTSSRLPTGVHTVRPLHSELYLPNAHYDTISAPTLENTVLPHSSQALDCCGGPMSFYAYPNELSDIAGPSTVLSSIVSLYASPSIRSHGMTQSSVEDPSDLQPLEFYEHPPSQLDPNTVSSDPLVDNAMSHMYMQHITYPHHDPHHASRQNYTP